MVEFADNGGAGSGSWLGPDAALSRSGEAECLVLMPCNSSALTSFQEHLACFLVHPIHAVRFLRQSICSLRHRSHGGITRSPFHMLSILRTISDLKGPPSSRSMGEGFIWGNSDTGVLGIATEGGFLPPSTPPAKSVDRDRCFSAEFCCMAVVRAVPSEDRRMVSSVKPASRSAGVKNLCSISLLTLGEGSSTILPLWLARFWLNASSTLPRCVSPVVVGAALDSGSCPACLKLTVIKPAGGECETSTLRNGLATLPLVSAGERGDARRSEGCFFASASCSRRAKIAVLRFFIL